MGLGRIGSLLQLELTKLGVIVLVQNIYHMCYFANPTTLQYPLSVRMFLVRKNLVLDIIPV